MDHNMKIVGSESLDKDREPHISKDCSLSEETFHYPETQSAQVTENVEGQPEPVKSAEGGCSQSLRKEKDGDVFSDDSLNSW